MSRFVLSEDTADIIETTIDGSSFAEEDTATLVLFLSESADSSSLTGFTLTGGHGILETGGRHSAAIFVDGCSPWIRSNRITGNYSNVTPAAYFRDSGTRFVGNMVFDNIYNRTSVRIGYNVLDGPVIMEGNFFGANPRVSDLQFPGLLVEEGAEVEIRNNTFRGLVGGGHAVLTFYGRNPVIEGNYFEDNYGQAEFSTIMWIEHDEIVLRDNAFRGNLVDDISRILLNRGQNQYNAIIEGNIFEHNVALANGPSTACIQLSGFGGTITNNLFRDNRGNSSGAVTVGQGGLNDPRPVIFEYNLFESCSASTSWPVDGIILHSGAVPVTARQNIFRQNYPVVVAYDEIVRSTIADFRDNYWGHPSGPYHPVLNPDGLGDTVGDSVLFVPWLTDSLIDDTGEPPAWIPRKTELISYPNPFNSTARLSLSVEKPGTYSVKLYSITGQLVQEVWRGGVVISREITVNAQDLASGVYFAAADDVETNLRTASVKMVLVK